MADSSEHSIELSGSIKNDEFIEHPNDCKLTHTIVKLQFFPMALQPILELCPLY
jgi:hypothetical protein